jgi:hypothetical protein
MAELSFYLSIRKREVKVEQSQDGLNINILSLYIKSEGMDR